MDVSHGPESRETKRMRSAHVFLVCILRHAKRGYRRAPFSIRLRRGETNWDYEQESFLHRTCFEGVVLGERGCSEVIQLPSFLGVMLGMRGQIMDDIFENCLWANATAADPR